MLTYLANFGLNRTQLLRILKLVASARQREHEEEIHHSGHDRLGLSRADGLHKDDIEARSLAEEDRLARHAPHPAQNAR